jgi:hypothetical protein
MPRANPETARLANTPNAVARSFPSAKMVVSSDSAAGARMAASAPCRARAATSTSKLGAKPAAADATANPARPMRKVRLRPNRSERRPPSRRRLPKASAYDVITQERRASLNPRSAWADGSAMLTMELSRVAMSSAMPRMAMTAQPRRARAVVGSLAAGAVETAGTGEAVLVMMVLRFGGAGLQGDQH